MPTITADSDRARLLALLRDWHVGYTVEEDGSIRVERGYRWFYTEFRFAPDGSFADMGAYE